MGYICAPIVVVYVAILSALCQKKEVDSMNR